MRSMLRGPNSRSSLRCKRIRARTYFAARLMAIAMTAGTKDIGGLRSAFAIRAAVITIFAGVAAATRVGALLWIFHTAYCALRVPSAFCEFRIR